MCQAADALRGVGNSDSDYNVVKRNKKYVAGFDAYAKYDVVDGDVYGIDDPRVNGDYSDYEGTGTGAGTGSSAGTYTGDYSDYDGTSTSTGVGSGSGSGAGTYTGYYAIQRPAANARGATSKMGYTVGATRNGGDEAKDPTVYPVFGQHCLNFPPHSFFILCYLSLFYFLTWFLIFMTWLQFPGVFFHVHAQYRFFHVHAQIRQTKGSAAETYSNFMLLCWQIRRF